MLYQVVGLVNRHVALTHFGAEATGKFSLATDLSLRLFGAANSLPELLLFQYVLKLDRTQGRAAAERQQSVNISLSLGFLAPLAVGYAVMAPTFEQLMAPAAYRGEFASLSANLAPGYFAQFALISAIGPIFQLRGATWQLSAAAVLALLADLALVGFTPLSDSLDGLAMANSLSLCAGSVGDGGAGVAAFVGAASRARPPGHLRRDGAHGRAGPSTQRDVLACVGFGGGCPHWRNRHRGRLPRLRRRRRADAACATLCAPGRTTKLFLKTGKA